MSVSPVGIIFVLVDCHSCVFFIHYCIRPFFSPNTQCLFGFSHTVSLLLQATCKPSVCFKPRSPVGFCKLYTKAAYQYYTFLPNRNVTHDSLPQSATAGLLATVFARLSHRVRPTTLGMNLCLIFLRIDSSLFCSKIATDFLQFFSSSCLPSITRTRRDVSLPSSCHSSQCIHQSPKVLGVTINPFIPFLCNFGRRVQQNLENHVGFGDRPINDGEIFWEIIFNYLSSQQLSLLS